MLQTAGRTRLSARSCISPNVRVALRENQVANRHAPGVETHDERRHRPRRHEGARAVDVGDRLGHRLGHVGAGMELELEQRGPLNDFDSTCSIPVM